MSVLVIAEHDNATVKGATLNTVAAAAQMGGDVHVLIAGHNAGAAAAALAFFAASFSSQSLRSDWAQSISSSGGSVPV